MVNHRCMNLEPACQLGSGLLALPGVQRHLCLNSGACCFRFAMANLLRVEDQQTVNRSLSQCLVSGGNPVLTLVSSR